MSEERLRVSRRELELLCRYSLAALNLPHGHVSEGAQLVAAAESKWGTGLSWLLGNVESIRETVLKSVVVDQSGLEASIDAGNVNLLSIAPVAIDYVVVTARRRGSASLRMIGVAGFPLALALVISVAKQQLESIVTIRYGTPRRNGLSGRTIVMPLMATASQDEDHATSGAMVSIAPDAVGEVYLSVTSVSRPAMTGTSRFGLSPSGGRLRSAPDHVLVDRGAWSELLDLVGGILPPDGRGHLTAEEKADLHEAGPGDGVLHDDD